GTNDRSLVLRARIGRHVVLLPGDLEAAGERALLLGARRAQLRATILKVGHHGSRTSTGRPFLAAVRPRIALISAGRGNRYGHPASSVTARLDRARILTWRTDRHGGVRLALPPGGPPRRLPWRSSSSPRGAP
ncbi:MAG: DNA internalization-related competence protein ComEC/Rec2, partial [Acidobacteriota bacterium]